VATADNIIVLENGRLREQGSHDELVRLDGPYSRLWEKQHGFVLNAARHQAAISIERLSMVPVFYGMSNALLQEATRLLQTEEFPADHMVLRAGEFGTPLYIIVRGSVELTSAETEPARTVLLEDGDCFGESAFVEAAPGTDNARTVIPSVFLTLSRAGFEYLAGKRDRVVSV